MKKIFLISALIITFGLAFVVNSYAHRYYSKEDIKVETKKIDKGIQIIMTSDDPEIAKELQENSRDYEDLFAYDDDCPHMRRMAYHYCGW